MAIRTIVTRGFGNGVFEGTIPLVVLRGYIPSQVVLPPGPAYRSQVPGIATEYLSRSANTDDYLSRAVFPEDDRRPVPSEEVN